MLNLTEKELESLLRFGLGTKRTGSLLSVKGDRLLHAGFLKRYLGKMKGGLNAPNEKVAASLMMKRCGMMTALHFYLFTVCGKRLPADPSLMSWEIDDGGQGWAPSFYFEHEAEIVQENRRQELEKLTEGVFKHHVDKLITACFQACSISKKILWENIAVYLFWMYETLQTEISDQELKKRAEQDFYYILYEAEPDLFGTDVCENPLAKFYQGQDAEQTRSTFCLYYATDKSGATCSTCPRKKQKERVS
ncbi:MULTISPECIES: IucA/IucC family C-terminal-domain containing protein [Bacillus]|uniref:IucA/IucC family C-terminal-domain containing protein n=1 Tax=Bacillus TaxID=1386 RepID=UPI0015840AAF|nr:IucA/IucC family C-terminal-domain containing protein [Bacillus glycinifermentans]MBU8785483.1 siderophore biosynthesis protein [Bacillus glycinifermentans]NUJ15803.1 siderophore biosynthesis protein [Bacillus glycinifermentans]